MVLKKQTDLLFFVDLSAINLFLYLLGLDKIKFRALLTHFTQEVKAHTKTKKVTVDICCIDKMFVNKS